MATDPLPPDAPRQGAGRPQIEVTDEDVRKIAAMAGYGLTQGIMAHVLGWSEDTFTSRKADDPRILRALESGKALAQVKVGEALYLKATGQVKTIVMNGEEVEVYTRAPETAAIRWWEMTRAGRADRVREVDPVDDYPTADEITALSTADKIKGLRSLLDEIGPEANGKKNGKQNGRHVGNGRAGKAKHRTG